MPTDRTTATTYSGQALVQHTSWADVLGDADRGVALYYWAPLDPRPVRLIVRRIFKNGKIRVYGPGGESYTFDSGHLPRFYRERFVPAWDR